MDEYKLGYVVIDHGEGEGSDLANAEGRFLENFEESDPGDLMDIEVEAKQPREREASAPWAPSGGDEERAERGSNSVLGTGQGRDDTLPTNNERSDNERSDNERSDNGRSDNGSYER